MVNKQVAKAKAKAINGWHARFVGALGRAEWQDEITRASSAVKH